MQVGRVWLTGKLSLGSALTVSSLQETATMRASPACFSSMARDDSTSGSSGILWTLWVTRGLVSHRAVYTRKHNHVSGREHLPVVSSSK